MMRSVTGCAAMSGDFLWRIGIGNDYRRGLTHGFMLGFYVGALVALLLVTLGMALEAIK